MLKTKRLLTDAEMDAFLKLREESSIKAAKYMKSLQEELFEVVEDDKRRNKRVRNIKVTEG